MGPEGAGLVPYYEIQKVAVMWIPAKELPELYDDGWAEQSELVLVYDGIVGMRVGYAQSIRYLGFHDVCSWYIAGPDGYALHEVTHWTELPDPPMESFPELEEL